MNHSICLTRTLLILMLSSLFDCRCIASRKRCDDASSVVDHNYLSFYCTKTLLFWGGSDVLNLHRKHVNLTCHFLWLDTILPSEIAAQSCVQDWGTIQSDTKPVPALLGTFKCYCRNSPVLLMTINSKNSTLDVENVWCNDTTHKTFELIEVLTHSSIYISLLPFADMYWRNVALISEDSISLLCHGGISAWP